jgi:hypothetical protein
VQLCWWFGKVAPSTFDFLLTSLSAMRACARLRCSLAVSGTLHQHLGLNLRVAMRYCSSGSSATCTPRPNVQTVFAVATSASKAAISIIRLSGPQAKSTLQALISGKREENSANEPKPRLLELHKLRHPNSGVMLDHAMTAWFPAPNSYTGEDMVELHVHGGRATVQAVQRTLAELPVTNG